MNNKPAPMPERKRRFSRHHLALVCLGAFLSQGVTAFAGMWTTGYYPGYEQDSMPASNIDFTTLSHVIHFSLVPNSDGSINSSANGITPGGSADLVSRAHAAGTKALICVGGADSETGFQGATSSTNLSKFVTNLVSFMKTYSYDGVDVDWEPLPVSDAAQYTNLINGLRASLNSFPQHELLTAAAAAYPVYGDPANGEAAMYASLQAQFDQINVMTYDLSGPYEGWITWFNSPIYDGGTTFPSTGGSVPSVNGALSTFIASGVAPSKMGIAIAFYGYVWSGGSGGTVPTGGVTLPRQSWSTAPTVATYPYSTIYSTYYQSNSYYWDTNAQAAYLSITNGGNKFISYDDLHACQAKVSYARNSGLGGLFVWELTQDYFPSQPPGQREPLLADLKQALLTPGNATIQISNQQVSLSFQSLPLAQYRVQWTSNVAGGSWNTLTNNVPGTGQPVQVIDTNSTAQPGRFYRVNTPP